MATDITLKQYDDGTGIKALLQNGNAPIDLTNADVIFRMSGYEVTANVTDAVNGEVIVAFAKEHTSKTGVNFAEFNVVFPDGRTETYPNDGYVSVNILRRVDE